MEMVGCVFYDGEGLNRGTFYKYQSKEGKKNVKLSEQSNHWSSTGV